MVPVSDKFKLLFFKSLPALETSLPAGRLSARSHAVTPGDVVSDPFSVFGGISEWPFECSSLT